MPLHVRLCFMCNSSPLTDFPPRLPAAFVMCLQGSVTTGSQAVRNLATSECPLRVSDGDECVFCAFCCCRIVWQNKWRYGALVFSRVAMKEINGLI
jgi:hypothetical protein